MLKKVEMDVEWPGLLGANQFTTSDQWKELRDALNKLYIGGGAVCLSYATKHEAELASSSTYGYAKKQNSKQAGWNYQTTLRPNGQGFDIYIRKIAARG